MSFNAQVGAAITARFPPAFTGYEVVDGSWKPKDLLMHEDHKGRKGTIFNTTFWGPGTEVDCELFQTDPTAADLKKSDVVNEAATDDNPSPSTWLVIKADPTKYGPAGVTFGVTLRKSDDQDLTQTTPST